LSEGTACSCINIPFFPSAVYGSVSHACLAFQRPPNHRGLSRKQLASAFSFPSLWGTNQRWMQAPRSRLPAPTSGILLEEVASADLRGTGQSDEQLRSAATIPESSTLPRDPRIPRPLVDRTRTCLSGWLLRDGCQALIVHPNCVREAAGFALCRDAGRSSMAQTREKSTGCCSYSVIMMSCLNHSDPCGQYRSPWLVIILPLLPASFAVCSCPPPQE
jgi:hypothetical protein